MTAADADTDAPRLPEWRDVLAACARIAPYAYSTPLLRSASLDAIAGAELHFKAEHLQRTGAFKFRGACNAVQALDAAQAARGVVTHSSGNHGAALALAARERGIACHVVVPEGALPSKTAAVAAYGASLHRCAPTMAAREAACAQVQAETGALLVHPYADFQVIAGQATAAVELLTQLPTLDAIVIPLGGGGLSAGTAIAAAALAPACKVYAAEPVGAADGFHSLQRGARVTDLVPHTVCDGLRGTIGEPNLRLLQRHGVEILLVDDADTLAAMRLFAQRAKQLIEPSSAIALAAVLANRGKFAQRRTGVLVSGGNIDVDVPFPWLTTQAGR